MTGSPETGTPDRKAQQSQAAGPRDLGELQVAALPAAELSAAERRRKKLKIRLAFVVAMALAGLVLIIGSSTLMTALTISGETNEVFTDAAVLPPDLIDSIEWEPDPTDLPRVMEPLTREAVSRSWLLAWEQLRIVAETGETAGVEVYFSDPARRSVLAAADAGDQSGQHRSVRQQSHRLELTFYSDDGQLIGLTSAESRLLRTERDGDSLWEQESVESYEVLLVLEDGNWRIHHMVRRSVEAGPWTSSDQESN